MFIKLQLYSLKLFFFSNQDSSNTNTASDEISAYTLDFALPSGWALKERQKFGKKGGGKRISKNVILYLEAYFLAGDVDKSEKYTAQEIYNKLKELVLLELRKKFTPLLITYLNQRLIR